MPGRISSGYRFDLPGFFHVQDIIFQISEIQGVGIVYPLQFFLMYIECGVSALVIVFAVVVV
jgi:hypothetical protein